jgi:hypothetical protein
LPLESLPDVLAIDFVEHFKSGSEKDAQDNGLFAGRFVYVENRRIGSAFITDRSKSTAVKIVNCR